MNYSSSAVRGTLEHSPPEAWRARRIIAVRINGDGIIFANSPLALRRAVKLRY